MINQVVPLVKLQQLLCFFMTTLVILNVRLAIYQMLQTTVNHANIHVKVVANLLINVIHVYQSLDHLTFT